MSMSNPQRHCCAWHIVVLFSASMSNSVLFAIPREHEPKRRAKYPPVEGLSARVHAHSLAQGWAGASYIFVSPVRRRINSVLRLGFSKGLEP